MALVSRIGADATGSEPSPAIWMRAINGDTMFHGKANYFWDDFKAWTDVLTSTKGQAASDGGGWSTYEDSGATILNIVGTGGELKFVTGATDNNSVTAMPGDTATTLGVVNTMANGMLPLFFEARVRWGGIVTQNSFIGLTEEALIADNGIHGDTGTVADKDLIGFEINESASSTLTFKYNKASAGGITTVIANIGTIVANTYYKLGFVFDPWETNTSRRGKIYVNGVEQGTYITDTNINNTTTFPSAQNLNVALDLKNNNANINMTVDWVRFLQFKEAY